MAFAPQGTPQRPLPGGFVNTPAPQRPSISQPSFSRQISSSGAQNYQRQGSSQLIQTGQSQQQLAGRSPSATGPQEQTPVERAAKTINDALLQESRFPELENYLGQGISSEYDIPENTAWAPFHKAKEYTIPDPIFDQSNQAQVSTRMGLFAELNHAWMTADSSLYLWDYTQPNPEIKGFEEQTQSINGVKLVVPRPGVFVAEVTHCLVVTTASELSLIGVACKTGPGDTKSVSLYATRLSVPIKGIDANCIEASKKTGRVFFAGHTNEDIYEFTYQQEEKWFSSRAAKINHTAKGWMSENGMMNLWTSKSPHKHVVQLVIDDSRNLLYSLSSDSTIRIFYIGDPGTLVPALSRPLSSLMSNVGHMVPRNELLQLPGTTITSIHPISYAEAARLNLMAVTSTGCRLFLSSTAGQNVYAPCDGTRAPTSMQVHHIKFPPRDMATAQQRQKTQPMPPTTPYGAPTVDTGSRQLMNAAKSARFPPGYFVCYVQGDQQTQQAVFLSAPDSGRFKGPQDVSQAIRFVESGQWMPTHESVIEIGLVTPPFAVTAGPLGFGNELAGQFDQPAAEIAMLTNSGIKSVRRRRLVDVFASAIRQGGGEEGLEGDVKKFVRLYGRTETAATAIAVACGQGSDETPDARLPGAIDATVVEQARKAFIEFGGKATINENSVLDNNASPIDNVRPSPRHGGMALYISRLVRSVWGRPVMREEITPISGLKVVPTVALTKLQGIQRDLGALQEFLDKNKSFIEGLAGPEAMGRVSTKQEEIALQGEHRAMNSLVLLLSSLIEGIAFVLVLFDERVEEILLSFSDNSRQRIRDLTFEGLFCTSNGKELAKELVKAIVNRNIANGSNVDTVADALRRRCGSFCSADDVVIFKAQEQLKRASEAGATSESGRLLLNESLRLFQKVAASLSMEYLQQAVEDYAEMAFYAGAIQLCLTVAHERDKANRALAWVKEGSPDQDPRKAAFEGRKRCYELVHAVIFAVDQASQQQPETQDGQLTLIAKRKTEAYDVINCSEDQVFQEDLYGWYLSQGWHDRLLEISSPFVVNYLQRKSTEARIYADLLWRYFSCHGQHFDAACVQLFLAESDFDLKLEQRIEYLSRARANASMQSASINGFTNASRQTRQELMRKASDLLDVANIQGDILSRMKSDERLTAERRPQVLSKLDNQILPIHELYNQYADQAGYFDIEILIYHVADYRNAADIRATWRQLIEDVHSKTEAVGEPLPYEAVAEQVRQLGSRLNLAHATFPVGELLPMLEVYAQEFQRNVGPSTWAVDLFLELGVTHETLLPILEQMFYSDEAPFDGQNRRIIAEQVVHVVTRWVADSDRNGDRMLFGSEENAAGVDDVLRSLTANRDLQGAKREEADEIRARIAQALR
ncbi:hypothetical protein LTR66_008670 [Elasticomyces elasticus]|nr:hypothetical protein LTR66_008670 [Elasticomyces elasticus]